MLEWIQERKVTLGLSDIDNFHAKSLLVIWCNKNTGTCPLPAYGTVPDDVTTDWTVRDGAVLTAFSIWWNASYRGSLPTGTAKSGGIVTTDLTQAHLDALDKWAISQGSVPSAPTPPPAPSTATTPNVPSSQCITDCQNKVGVLDPIALAQCIAQCGQIVPSAPPIPPVGPTPPTPPTAPAPAPIPAPTKASNGWIIATIAAGAVVLGMIAYQMGKSA